MKVAAAEAIFSVVGDDLAVDHIVPSALDPRVGPAVAAAVAAASEDSSRLTRRFLEPAGVPAGRRCWSLRVRRAGAGTVDPGRRDVRSGVDAGGPHVRGGAAVLRQPRARQSDRGSGRPNSTPARSASCPASPDGCCSGSSRTRRARSDAQVYRTLVSALPEGVAAGDYTHVGGGQARASRSPRRPPVTGVGVTCRRWSAGASEVTVGAVKGGAPPVVGRYVHDCPKAREFPDDATLFAALAVRARSTWRGRRRPRRTCRRRCVVLADKTSLIRAENVVPLYRRNELTESQVLALNEIAGVLDTGVAGRHAASGRRGRRSRRSWPGVARRPSARVGNERRPRRARNAFVLRHQPRASPAGTAADSPAPVSADDDVEHLRVVADQHPGLVLAHRRRG